jgi:hypothetical protein
VAAPAELEQIIRDELRAPVSELVRQVVIELVREQLNGAAEVHVDAVQSPPKPATRPGPTPKPAPAERRCARSQLHVWDGLGHCFYLDPDLPEAREIEKIIVDFFAQTLDGAGT